jgi:glucans biosynthesis protein
MQISATRRQLLAAGLAMAVGRLPAVRAQSTGALFASIAAQAEALARAPYQAPPPIRRPELLALGYDQYRDFRPLPGTLIWDGDPTPFRVALFPAGSSHRDPVDITLVDGGAERPLVVAPTSFTWPPGIDPGSGPLEVAGFRVHYPLNRADVRDEVAVFLDASYFRLLGRGQIYGASARGLAIDTGLPRREEFPAFRHFWLVKPEAEGTSLTIYALLDSLGIAGAYEFVLRPGEATTLDVAAQLFPRHGISLLGVAPLTSMFLAGENTGPTAGDYRPEVHDSDGLLIETAHERTWRPLANRRAARVTRLPTDQLRGFGLLQRDRSFASYQDNEALYHRRPSLWVRPVEPFGPGAVHLLELPTDNEFNDNIVAFWASDAPTRPGARIALRYQVAAISGDPPAGTLARAIATRTANSRLPGAAGTSHARRVIVDFAGSALAQLDADQTVAAAASAQGGQIRETRVEKLREAPIPEAGAWRMTLEVVAAGEQPVELRAVLTRNDAPVSETWSYALP